MTTTGKPFAVFDIDGTLIRWQLYHSIVEELARQGAITTGQHQRIKDARMIWKNRQHDNTFSDYQSTLVEIFHTSLDTMPVELFETAIEHVFSTYKDQVYTYTRDLIKDLKSKNYLLFAISGSHHEIIQLMANHYGFDEAVGNRYLRSKGRFTGEHQFIVERKPEILSELVKKHRAIEQGSIAVGDSGSDISMLESVEQPIAFNPDKRLYKAARSHNWKIVIERKNMIYQLESHDGQYILD